MSEQSVNQITQVSTIEALRSQITPRQRAILDDIWSYVLEKRTGIPERSLFHKHGREIVALETKALGGSILYSGHQDNQMRFSIGFVGIFVTSDGSRLEELVKRYLIYLKDRFESDTEIEKLSSKDFSVWEPPLLPSELNELPLSLDRRSGTIHRTSLFLENSKARRTSSDTTCCAKNSCKSSFIRLLPSLRRSAVLLYLAIFWRCLR
jgi:hypothetical protein